MSDVWIGQCYVSAVETPPNSQAKASPGRIRQILYAGFFLSGAAGLVDEVVWSKMLAGLLGSTATAHMIVLATFMGGLALGNRVFGRLADSGTRLIRLYAILEICIGLFCLFFPEIFHLSTDLYIATAQPLGPDAWLLQPLKVIIAACTILLPTFLMGGTLPVLARGVVASMGDVTAGVGRLYFINSLGAVAGVALGGFFLVPTLGLSDAIRLSAACNLLLGIFFLVWDRQLARAGVGLDTSEPAEAMRAESPAYGPKVQRLVFWVIAISGGVSMLYEVAWTRLLSLVLGSSTYSFTIMLLTFILGITLGSFAISRKFAVKEGQAPPDPLLWLAIAEFGVFVSILPVLPIYDELPFTFATLASLLPRTPEYFGLYVCIKVAVSMVLLFLPTFFIGMTLPLASRICVKRFDTLGAGVGSVFSANIWGGVVGAVLTGLLLIPALQLHATLVTGMALSLALGAAVLGAHVATSRRVRFGVPISLTLLFALVLGGWGQWDAKLLNYGIYRHKTFAFDTVEELKREIAPLDLVYVRDGKDASVAVLRDSRTGNLYLKVNGKTDAGTGQDMATQLWLGHLGMLLKPDAEKVMVIGLGSGITPAAVLRHPVKHVDVVEISEAVVEASEHFAPYNYDVLADPRLTLHVTDAKEYFNLRPEGRYDLVISEPSNPWIAGIGGLFSVEYFQQIRHHLNDDGLVVQWLHLYELNDELAGIIINTLSQAFEHVEVWDANESLDVLVVGSKRPIDVDPSAIRARLSDPRVQGDLNRPHLPPQARNEHDFMRRQMLSREVVATHFPGTPPFNTDDHPILEYQAPKAFFANERSTVLMRLDERRLPVKDRRTHAAKLAGETP